MTYLDFKADGTSNGEQTCTNYALVKANDTAWGAAGGEIKMTEDVAAEADDTPLEVPADKTVTLDLNGHTIDRALTAAMANGNVITVNGALTVTDSSATDTQAGSGKITGGYITGSYAQYGGGVYVYGNGATFTMKDGSISGNSTSYNFDGLRVLCE